MANREHNTVEARAIRQCRKAVDVVRKYLNDEPITTVNYIKLQSAIRNIQTWKVCFPKGIPNSPFENGIPDPYEIVAEEKESA